MIRKLSVALSACAAIMSACADPLPSNPGGEPRGLGTTTIEPVSYDALYVVNGDSASISVINAEKNEVASTIKIRGAAYPHNISLSPDGSTLALAVPGFDLSGGEYGHEMHATVSGQVIVLDALTGELKGSVSTAAATHNVVFAPEGHSLWTSQATTPGSTIVLDAESLKTRGAISVGTSPAETVISRDGKSIFVANAGSASLSVISIADQSLRKTINVGNGPVLAQEAPDGIVFVENEADQSISVIDMKSLSLVQTFPLGYTPGSLAAPSASEVWVTAPKRGLVEVRNATGAVLKTVSTGAGAHGLAFSADGTRAYVSNLDDDSVSVIDRATMTVKARIPVGSKPNGMTWRSR
jgi:YVTN family beta-propeller protein